MIEIQAPDGRIIEVEGDKIPTRAEMDNIFKATGTVGEPLTQSVMDNDDGKMYNVPASLDGISTRYAIETQHKGANKGDFFGKVMALTMPTATNLWNASQETSEMIAGEGKGKGMTALGDRFEKNWRAIDRAIVEHAGSLSDTFLEKGYHYQEKMKRLEKIKKGDFSDFGKDLTEEEKENLKKTYEDKVNFVKQLREKNKAFWNKGSQALMKDEEVDKISELMMGLSSGAISVAEAATMTVATKNPTVGSAIIAGLFGALKDTEYFDRAIESGTDAETASRDAKVAGSIEGVIELIGDRILMGVGKIPQIQQIGQRVVESAAVKMAQKKLTSQAVKGASKHLDKIGTQALKGFVVEGSEEGSQQGLGMVWENLTGVSNYSTSEILGETLWATAIGGLTGSGFGVIGTSTHNREVLKTNQKIKSTLKQTNPELNEEELQQTADALQEILFQENASYTKELNTLLEKELQPDTMPEGLTAESLTQETRKLLKENYGMTDEQIDKTVNASLSFIDARNQFNETYTTMRDAIEKAGINQTTADSAARLLSARALAVARAEKSDVKSVIDRWGLQFKGMAFSEFQKKFNERLNGDDKTAIEILRQDINRIKKGVSRNAKKGLRLSQFLKQKGGIKDDRGDIKSMGANVGLLNKNGISLDEATRLAWEAGYIQGSERPEINQLLDLLSDDLGNKPVYSFDDQIKTDDRQYYLELERALDEAGADINKDSLEEIARKLNAYEKKIAASQNGMNEYNQVLEDLGDFIPFQESMDIARKNEELDKKYPEYTGETLVVYGKERTVYNSNGERIAKSKEALENFYKWFGESKVVDEQGRPLVVYHGTNAEFDTFNLGKNGYFFTPDLDNAQIYANEAQFEKGGKKIVMPVYLNTEKLKELYSYDELRNIDVLSLKKQGYDGAYYKSETQPIYVAFESNQIKSTSNRGTYSESDNIYYQFAGENAQTAALDELENAKQLEADGIDNEEIRQQTGWFKGADGKWRFEISDKDATINRQVLKDIGSIENLRAERDQLLDDIEAFKKEREKNNDAYPAGYLDELISQRYDKIEKIDYDIDHGYVSSAKTTLGELLNHDKLYDAYPSLRYMPVTMRTSDDLSGGAYSRKDNTIYLDSRLSDDEIKSILMHEIQHVIQEKENFARGGNTQFAKDYKKIIEKKASAEFMDLLDKKMKEGLERELKEYNLNKKAIVEILDAYSDYTKKFFDTDAENEEIIKAEKKYYETLEKHNISSDILENAMNNLRDQGIWKEAENEVKSKNKLSDADAYEIYRAFFGEVEARNTQARMDLTEEERRDKTPESTQDIANADALIVMPDGTAMAYGSKGISQQTKQKAKEVKGALQKIAEGAEEATVKDLRDDLEQYGGTNDVTFIYGDEKKGLFHIADKHGGIKTLLKVLDTVVDGKIVRHSNAKKTVVLSKGDYEAVLSLDENGNKKTWLLTGFDTKISPDAERQVSANLKATQTKPTFSRQDLGAGLNEFNIAPSAQNVKGDVQFQYQDKINREWQARYGNISVEEIKQDLSREEKEIYQRKKDAGLSEKQAIIEAVDEIINRDSLRLNTEDTLPRNFLPPVNNPRANSGQAPRGAFYDRVIYLFENADASTVVHEMAHFFLDDMKRFSDNAETAKQLDAIYAYLGSKDGNLSYEQNELFANSFEVYLLEGKAPNQLLGKVFDRFKKWLRSLYTEVKRLGGIKLNNDIRKTFDEMLGGRSLDYTLQISNQKMAENASSGYISPMTANLAVDLLRQGKMSKADMEDILERLKNGELQRSEVRAELKKFENSNVKNNEALNPFDAVKYKEALLRGNVTKTKVLEKIDRLMKWSEPKTVNGRLVGRFPNKRMNDFFAAVNEEMKMDKAEAKKRISENKAVITAILESREIPSFDRDTVLGMKVSENNRPELMNALALENRVLSIADKTISLDNALKLYSDLSDSYNVGRLTANITGDLKKARKQRMIADAVRTLVGVGKENPNIERSIVKKALNRAGTSMMSWGGLMDILSMNDKSKVGQSALSKMMDVFGEEQKQAQGVADDGEMLCRMFEKKLGGVNNGAITVSKYINNELNKKTTLEWTGHKKTFTKDELIDIYMKAKDQETLDIMLNDKINGYNNEFLALVNQNLNADDRAFADALFEFYNDNWAKINAFYEEKYGISLPKNDYYSPRSMMRSGISVEDGSPAFATSGFTKARTAKVGASINIKGAFKVWNNYVVNTNRWLAWSDKLVDINSVFGDTEVKKIIENLFGENMNKRIRGEVERMAGAGGDRFSEFFSSKLLTKLRGNYAKSVLALKPSLMIKQLTSFPAYWNEMSAKDFATGLADFFAHPKEAIETLGNTTLMKTRGTDIIRDFAEISKMDILKGKKGIKFSDAMMLNIKLGDRGAIYMGGWALYKSELKKNLAKGMSEEQAKAKAFERFERVTDETQQSGRLSQQSYWQSNPALRMFTMFMSSQNQYLRKEIGAVRGLMTGRVDKTQAMKTLFIFHVLLPCLFQFASDGFDWDKDAQLRSAILGSLNGVFILGTLLEKLYERAMGEKTYNSHRLGVREIVPFWGSFEDLEKQFVKMAEDDVDLTDMAAAFELFTKVTKPVGEIFGLPLKYPFDVIKNFGDYAEKGEYNKEVLLWLGWSPYSLRDKD